MKKMIAAVLLAASGAAMAAGPYDGVYVNLASSGSYLSVHTNGDRVIATLYGIIPASGIEMYSAIGNVRPTQLNTWDLINGTISGNVAQISGQILFNACTVGLTVTFAGNGSATGRITSAGQTPVGRSSGVDCAALPGVYPNGIQFSKAF
jgi:hypothetical protein